jgi:hypothetical protein
MGIIKRWTDRAIVTHNFRLSQGEVEEARSFMKFPGKIDVSGLSFHAAPYQDGKEEHVSGINETWVDIAVFPLPRSCRQDHCDLTELGVGARENSDFFVELCHNGRLQIRREVFHGFHTALKVPTKGPMEKHVLYGLFDARDAGQEYDVIIANCHMAGRQIHVKGQAVFDFGRSSEEHFDPATSLPYPLTSLTVFLGLALCFFRIRCTSLGSSRRSDGRNETVEISSVD